MHTYMCTCVVSTVRYTSSFPGIDTYIVQHALNNYTDTHWPNFELLVSYTCQLPVLARGTPSMAYTAGSLHEYAAAGGVGKEC